MKLSNPLTFRKHVEAAKNKIDDLYQRLTQEREAAEVRMVNQVSASNQRLTNSLDELAAVRSQLAQVTTINTTRQRIGSVRIDPQALTSAFRRVVPSVWMEQEGNLYVVYTSQTLPEGDFNRVQAELMACLEMDRT